MDSEWLAVLIDKYHHPQRYKKQAELDAVRKPTLLELFDEFLEKHKLSEVRKKNYRVVRRGLERYQGLCEDDPSGAEGLWAGCG